MLAYRRLERVLWTLCVAYVLAGVYQQLVLSGGDREQLFPVASWALFAKVPGEMTDYGVRLLELNGEPVASNPAGNAGDRLPALATDDGYHLIQELGRALQKDDRNRAAQARRALEALYLRGAEPFRYEVVRRTYDPLERWHDGTVRAAQTLEQFDSRAAQ